MAFDFENMYDGKTFEKEFNDLVCGTTTPPTEPILTVFISRKYHQSKYKITLTLKDYSKEFNKKIKKINE